MNNNSGVSLADIARSIKMNPKNARAKVRRLDVPAKYLADKDSWTFKKSAVTWVKVQLRRDDRKTA